MDRSPLLSFRGRRAPDGYHLEDSEYGQLIRPNSERRELCQPLTGEEFRIFASRASSPEGTLDFVHRYGPVTSLGQSSLGHIPPIGDRVETVMKSARVMRRMIDAMTNPRLTSEELQNEANVWSLSRCDVEFVWDATRKAFAWRFRTDSLLDALWLQLGKAMLRGAQLLACLHCGELFEAGGGTGRRADAKFCSEEHKVAFHSLKRSRR